MRRALVKIYISKKPNFNKIKMKVITVIVWIGILISVITTAEASINFGLQSSYLQSNCKPCMVFFVWGCEDSEDNMEVQKYFLNRVMDTITISSSIRVRVCDNTVINFTIDDPISVLENFALVDFETSDDSMISFSSLQKDISGSIQQKTKNESFQLFFLVNEKTLIDQKETAMEEFKNNKVFVLYYGPSPVPYFWKSLATDKHHLLHLKNNTEDEFLAVLDVLCHDSRIYCDNDMYWNGSDCITCSYICTQIPSDYCKKECPYVKIIPLEVKQADVNTRLPVCECSNAPSIVFGIIIVLLQGLIIFNQMSDYFRKKFKRVLKKHPNQGGNETQDDNETDSSVQENQRESDNAQKGPNQAGTQSKKKNNSGGKRKYFKK